MKKRYLWLLPPAVFLVGYLFGWFVSLEPDVRQWDHFERYLLASATLLGFIPAFNNFFLKW